ncbi:MAG: class I SAM-dependent methyltransferase [Rhodoferax sp.]
MNEYWKEHFNANALKFPDSPLKQVAATVYGREVDRTQLNLIVDAIVENLALVDTDHVADFCCGNGVITKEIAARVRFVDGVDFSENLVRNACAIHAAPNIKYSVSDVAALPDTFFAVPNKGYMCYAVQHLSDAAVKTLLDQIAAQEQWTSFFISGIPDIRKLSAFYDTDEKMAFYCKREASGEPHLGKWWSHTEMEMLAKDAGLDIQFVPQPPQLYSAHYRFDCLIHRKE